ncbi:hypothetical protein V2J09_021240 [Rumex salicifolius]
MEEYIFFMDMEGPRDVVLVVASNGIASLLVHGGRIAHSRCCISHKTCVFNIMPHPLMHKIFKNFQIGLHVGDGDIGELNDGEGIIDIPPQFLITDDDKSNPISAIVDAIYPDLLQSLSSHEYFRERAILAPTRDVVDEVNEYMMSLIPVSIALARMTLELQSMIHYTLLTY